jgi:hypothetical protein
MIFSPTVLRRCGKPILLTFGGQLATIVAGVGGAGRFRSSSALMSAGSGAPPAKLRAPAWVSVFGEAPGAVDLALESG